MPFTGRCIHCGHDHGNAVFSTYKNIPNTASSNSVSTIEQLTARVRELEEEKKELQALLDFDNARLDQIEDELEDVEYLGPYVEGIKVLKTQLAAAQLDNQRLREALEGFGRHHPDCYSRKPVNPCDCGLSEALSTPADTSALDAYVAEKVKEALSTIKESEEK